jgi:hypothetical protein
LYCQGGSRACACRKRPAPASCPHTRYRRRRPRDHQRSDDSLASSAPYWLGDSAVRLHALASLIAQAKQPLPGAVRDARDQELTWTQIGELLNTTAATGARRYRNKAMINLTKDHQHNAENSALPGRISMR